MLNDCFHDRQLVVLGDPNARISTPKSSKKKQRIFNKPRSYHEYKWEKVDESL